MKVVYKYSLPKYPFSNEYQIPTIEVEDVKHVGWQHGNPYMWIEVDANRNKRRYAVDCYPTGKEFVKYTGGGTIAVGASTHIGTLINEKTGEVWHYYMRQMGSVERLTDE